MRKKIYYKSLFDYGGQKDKIEYIELGTYIKEEEHQIRMSTKDGEMRIFYDDENVRLMHNQSLLRFKKGERILNHYKTIQGEIPLVSEVESLNYTKDTLRFIYHLYQGETHVARVFLYVRMQELGVYA